MSNLSVIVTIHDQSLLLEYEAQKKFELLSDCVTYMFVGKGDVDKVDKKVMSSLLATYMTILKITNF